MPQAQSVIDTIAGCFDNGIYSDLTIECHHRSWKVHRVVVCSQSKVLHAACMAGFKEQYTGVIVLEDDNPVTVEILLKYFMIPRFYGFTFMISWIYGFIHYGSTMDGGVRAQKWTIVLLP